MGKYVEAVIYLMVDANGDFVCHSDADELRDLAAEELDTVYGLRKVEVTVKVPLPEMLKATAEVVEDDAEASATAA